MIHRGVLISRAKATLRGQKISKRTRLSFKAGLEPILFIDGSYLAYLLEYKNSFKRSKIYKLLSNQKIVKSILYDYENTLTLEERKGRYHLRQYILDIIEEIIKKANTNKITIIFNSAENKLQYIYSQSLIRKLCEPFKFDVITLKSNERFCDYIFTFCKCNPFLLEDKLLIYVTNSITTWACASLLLHHAFIAIGKDNKALMYNEKTGLDILAKYIGTYRIINKLNLDTYKLLNLQYLFILILFIRFLTQKNTSEEYFFDYTYYHNHGRTNHKNFLGIHGSGYSLITQANRNLAYFFFTYKESMDKFLFLNVTEFEKHMSSLKRSIDFDSDLLLSFKRFYNKTERLNSIVRANIKFTIPNGKIIKYTNKSDDRVKNIQERLNSLHNIKTEKQVKIEKESKEDMDSVQRILRELFN